jgi:tRNA nucleotidyltransferase (CCA-adding enzyme)
LNRNIELKLPSGAAYIIKQLESNGYEAFVVGGCVRDSLIGLKPQDWDIATSATPEEVGRLFTKTIATGLKHGTVTVMLDNQGFEVTTYRIEGKYIKNRRPESVEFTNSIEKDLSRRDFTVNAMAYNPNRGLIDPFGGLLDIEAKLIKAVGIPEQRFEEDALRMLRALRFSAQLGYTIEADTLAAIVKCRQLIKNISGERIRDELTKILMADPMTFELMHATGLLKEIIPELDICFLTPQRHPYHVYNVGMHILHATSNMPKDPILRWVMLLHDIGKPVVRTTDEHGIDHFTTHQRVSEEMAIPILQRLRFDNSSMSKIRKLILEHDRIMTDNEKSVRKAVAAIGADLFEDWLQIRRADMLAQNPEKIGDRIVKLGNAKEIYHRILEEKHCLTLKELAIGGRELMELGVPEGARLGQILNQLLEDVIEHPELNQRETLIEMATKLI